MSTSSCEEKRLQSFVYDEMDVAYMRGGARPQGQSIRVCSCDGRRITGSVPWWSEQGSCQENERVWFMCGWGELWGGTTGNTGANIYVWGIYVWGVYVWGVYVWGGTTGAKQSRSGPAKSETVTHALCVSDPLPPNISPTWVVWGAG